MKISIFASIGSQNLGDELILKNEIKILEDKYGKNINFFVFSYDYKNPFFVQENIKYLEYFPIGIKKIKNVLKNIFNFLVFLKTVLSSDLIIIGGGGIIYDEENQSVKNPLNQWLFRINIFKFFRKKFEFFGVGINIKNDKHLTKLKKIFSKANSISIRDKYSFEILKSLNIKSKIIKDPVFFDNKISEKNNESNLIKKVNSFDFGIKNLENINFKGKIVGIALRKGYLINENTKFNDRIEEGKINEFINFIIKQGGKIILIPHSFHKTDSIANDYIFLKKFAKNKNVFICENMQESYIIYKDKKIDLCLSMRLHSIILSQVYNIPFIGISYSKKTEELLNSL